MGYSQEDDKVSNITEVTEHVHVINCIKFWYFIMWPHLTGFDNINLDTSPNMLFILFIYLLPPSVEYNLS